MNQSTILRYKDESDKSYGVVGMALSAFVLDFDRYLSSVNIDSDDMDCVQFIPEYYFSGNPSVSARVAWNLLVERFQNISGLLLGNVLCRLSVVDKQLSKAHYDSILMTLEEAGKDMCQLEKEEIVSIINKEYQQLHRIFGNKEVNSLVEELHQKLVEKRCLCRNEIMEFLNS